MNKKHYCKESNCDNEICYQTAYYGNGRCNSCASKKELNGFYGKHHTKKTRKQMSINHADISGDKNPLKKLDIRKKVSKTLQGRKIVWADKIRQTMFLNGTTKGKNNPRYIDGKSKEPYPLEFNESLKESVRQRDNYKCQKCGMTEEEHLIVFGEVLNVHHIDYNKFNCNKRNLMSLCLKCNLKVNSNRDYWYAYFIYLMEYKK